MLVTTKHFPSEVLRCPQGRVGTLVSQSLKESNSRLIVPTTPNFPFADGLWVIPGSSKGIEKHWIILLQCSYRKEYHPAKEPKFIELCKILALEPQWHVLFTEVFLVPTQPHYSQYFTPTSYRNHGYKAVHADPWSCECFHATGPSLQALVEPSVSRA